MLKDGKLFLKSLYLYVHCCIILEANYTCSAPNYKCEHDSVRLCLKPKELCDGNFDCTDKSDEGSLCDSKYSPNYFIPLQAGIFFMCFYHLLIFFEKKFFEGCNQHVKLFGSR